VKRVQTDQTEKRGGDGRLWAAALSDLRKEKGGKIAYNLRPTFYLPLLTHLSVAFVMSFPFSHPLSSFLLFVFGV